MINSKQVKDGNEVLALQRQFLYTPSRCMSVPPMLMKAAVIPSRSLSRKQATFWKLGHRPLPPPPPSSTVLSQYIHKSIWISCVTKYNRCVRLRHAKPTRGVLNEVTKARIKEAASGVTAAPNMSHQSS